jgi:aspartate/methionine/tyrosine aminotransferase
MTGWRVGYAMAPPDLALAMTNLQEFVVSHAPGIAQEAARVALIDGEPFILESQARYARHRQLALDRFRAMNGVTVPEPTGAFYVCPRLEGLADSFDFCRWLVEEKGVGLAPGNAFGQGGEGHIRLCFAVEEAILSEALDRFEAGWNAYRQSK